MWIGAGEAVLRSKALLLSYIRILDAFVIMTPVVELIAEVRSRTEHRLLQSGEQVKTMRLLRNAAVGFI